MQQGQLKIEITVRTSHAIRFKIRFYVGIGVRASHGLGFFNRMIKKTQPQRFYVGCYKILLSEQTKVRLQFFHFPYLNDDFLAPQQRQLLAREDSSSSVAGKNTIFLVAKKKTSLPMNPSRKGCAWVEIYSSS